MNNPKISIIIPNYNHAPFLDERIKSILSQTYHEIEIIILDDYSTDNSVEIIEKYKDNPLITRIVANAKNSGSTFEQWEKGFELSSGDYIWIAESDDSCSPYLLEVLIKPMLDDKDCVLSFSRSLRINRQGIFYKIFDSQQDMNEKFSIKGREFIDSYLKWQNYVVNASSAIFKKSVLGKIRHDYKTWKGCGDWLFWIYICEKGNVSYTPYALNYFRYHTLNTTSVKDKDGTNDKEMKLIIDYLDSNGFYSREELLSKKIGRYMWHKSVLPFESKGDENKFLKDWGITNFSLLQYNFGKYAKILTRKHA